MINLNKEYFKPQNEGTFDKIMRGGKNKDDQSNEQDIKFQETLRKLTALRDGFAHQREMLDKEIDEANKKHDEDNENRYSHPHPIGEEPIQTPIRTDDPGFEMLVKFQKYL